MKIAPINLKNRSEKFVQRYKMIPIAVLWVSLQSTFQIEYVDMEAILRSDSNYASKIVNINGSLNSE